MPRQRRINNNASGASSLEDEVVSNTAVSSLSGGNATYQQVSFDID
jgi:hypothetical protein